MPENEAFRNHGDGLAVMVNAEVLSLEQVKDLALSFEKVNGSHFHPKGDPHGLFVCS